MGKVEVVEQLPGCASAGAVRMYLRQQEGQTLHSVLKIVPNLGTACRRVKDNRDTLPFRLVDLRGFDKRLAGGAHRRGEPGDAIVADTRPALHTHRRPPHLPTALAAAQTAAEEGLPGQFRRQLLRREVEVVPVADGEKVGRMVHHNVKGYVMFEEFAVLTRLLDQEEPVWVLGGCCHMTVDIVHCLHAVACDDQPPLREILLQEWYEGFHLLYVQGMVGIKAPAAGVNPFIGLDNVHAWVTRSQRPLMNHVAE